MPRNSDRSLPHRRTQALFVPFVESLLTPLAAISDRLVPFQREYICVRLANGELEMRELPHTS